MICSSHTASKAPIQDPKPREVDIFEFPSNGWKEALQREEQHRTRGESQQASQVLPNQKCRLDKQPQTVGQTPPQPTDTGLTRDVFAQTMANHKTSSRKSRFHAPNTPMESNNGFFLVQAREF